MTWEKLAGLFLKYDYIIPLKSNIDNFLYDLNNFFYKKKKNGGTTSLEVIDRCYIGVSDHLHE